MAKYPTLWLFLCCTLWGIVFGAEDNSFSISLAREIVDHPELDDDLDPSRKRQTIEFPSKRGKSLYWTANITVGDSGPLRLQIDSGSTDLIVDKGYYKPGPNATKYGTGKFSASYEGVNRPGFGFQTIKGTVKSDVVSVGNLTIPNQAVGYARSWKYYDVPQLPFAVYGQGIIGFEPRGSAFHPPSPSWFANLCSQKVISKCIFGLAFGTSGKGTAIIGKFDESLVQGPVVTVPKYRGDFTALGDVTVDNKIVLKNQNFMFDSATDNIQGPLKGTQKVFDALGFHGFKKSKNQHHNPETLLKSYFPCDSPPTLGFSFPASKLLKPGEKATIFNVSPDVWDVYDHGNNNCTSILGGTNANGKQWLLGQSFFSGHYINYDVSNLQISFANLKDPSGASFA